MKTNNIYIQNNSTINYFTNEYQYFANDLEYNLNILTEYKNNGLPIEKNYLFELSTFKNKYSYETIVKYIQSIYKLDSLSELYNKANNLIKILHSNREYKEVYVKSYENLPQMKLLQDERFNITFIKNDFIFDFENNKVTVNPERLKEIENKYTYSVNNKKQEKAVELLNIIIENLTTLEQLTEKENIILDLAKCYQHKDLIIYNPIEFNKNDFYHSILKHIK